MSTALAPRVNGTHPVVETQLAASTLEKLLVHGDLKELTASERLQWYKARCEAAGLDPRTQPFQYIVLSGKLTLYATKAATEQLRKIHGVSVTGLTPEQIGDIYVVTCNVQDATGRKDSATGAVAVSSLRGEALANALMKAETKAKRRATLSITGMGMLDESEVDSIPDAVRYDPDKPQQPQLDPPSRESLNATFSKQPEPKRDNRPLGQVVGDACSSVNAEFKGQFPDATGEPANPYQVERHLYKWVCEQTGEARDTTLKQAAVREKLAGFYGGAKRQDIRKEMVRYVGELLTKARERQAAEAEERALDKALAEVDRGDAYEGPEETGAPSLAEEGD